MAQEDGDKCGAGSAHGRCAVVKGVGHRRTSCLLVVHASERKAARMRRREGRIERIHVWHSWVRAARG